MARQQTGSNRTPASGETKTTILLAGLETLKARGFAGSSAREIAKTGGFNQALIFYHFNSVRNLLVAVLDHVSQERMRAYGQAFEDAGTLSELAALAAEIYREDLENGYVTVLGEMVAGAMSDPVLGREVTGRIEPWAGMVERKVQALVRGSVFEAMIPPRDLAFAIIALYLGVDMITHLDGDRSKAESLLSNASQLAPMLQLLLPGTEQSVATPPPD